MQGRITLTINNNNFKQMLFTELSIYQHNPEKYVSQFPQNIE